MTREQMDRLKRALMSIALYDEQITLIEGRMMKTTQSISETGVRGGGASADKFGTMIYACDIYKREREKCQKEADNLMVICNAWLATLADDMADTIRRVELNGEPLARIAQEKGIARTTLYDRIQRQYEGR